MKRLTDALRFLLLLFAMSSLSACAALARYSRYPGVTFVSPRGLPRANLLAWSPTDPESLLVTSSGLPGRPARIEVLNLAEKNRRLIAEASSEPLWASDWSPDGKSIVLFAGRGIVGYSQSGLWLLNLEDGSKRFLSSTTGSGLWFPDGETVAVLGVEQTTEQNPRELTIRLIHTQTGVSTLVYTDRQAGWFTGGAISPSGRQIAFGLSSFDNKSDIHVLNLVSGNAVQLTHDGGSTDPSWSPKGNLIAYVRDRDKAGRTGSWLHLITPDGKCEIEFPQFSDAYYPTWSPDGKRLAFIGPDGIYVADLETLLGRDVTLAPDREGGLCLPSG